MIDDYLVQYTRKGEVRIMDGRLAHSYCLESVYRDEDDDRVLVWVFPAFFSASSCFQVREKEKKNRFQKLPFLHLDRHNST